MSANADNVGFKLAYTASLGLFRKIFGKTYCLLKMANGLIQECCAIVILGIGKFHVLSKMCNKNGNSHLMTYEDKLTLNLTCVPLCLLKNTVCSFKSFEQCMSYSMYLQVRYFTEHFGGSSEKNLIEYDICV